VAGTPLSDDDDLYRLPFDKVLGPLQLSTLLYYLHKTNPDNGLVRDKTDPNSPVSIAAAGMALATIPDVVARRHPLGTPVAQIRWHLDSDSDYDGISKIWID
jgi:hypothetical protein